MLPLPRLDCPERDHDVQWLQQLHQYGLVRGGFHSRAGVAQLRTYLRLRERMVEYGRPRAAHAEGFHADERAASPCRLRHHLSYGLSQCSSDCRWRSCSRTTGDVSDVACLRRDDSRSTDGKLPPRSMSLPLKQALELWDFHQIKVAECDIEIEAVLKSLNEGHARPGLPCAKARSSSTDLSTRADPNHPEGPLAALPVASPAILSGFILVGGLATFVFPSRPNRIHLRYGSRVHLTTRPPITGARADFFAVQVAARQALLVVVAVESTTRLSPTKRSAHLSAPARRND